METGRGTSREKKTHTHNYIWASGQLRTLQGTFVCVKLSCRAKATGRDPCLPMVGLGGCRSIAVCVGDGGGREAPARRSPIISACAAFANVSVLTVPCVCWLSYRAREVSASASCIIDLRVGASLSNLQLLCRAFLLARRFRSDAATQMFIQRFGFVSMRAPSEPSACQCLRRPLIVALPQRLGFFVPSHSPAQV